MGKKPISIPAQKPNTSGKKHVSGSEQFRIERISEFVEEFGIERICFITETKRSHKDQPVAEKLHKASHNTYDFKIREGLPNVGVTWIFLQAARDIRLYKPKLLNSTYCISKIQPTPHSQHPLQQKHPANQNETHCHLATATHCSASHLAVKPWKMCSLLGSEGCLYRLILQMDEKGMITQW
jgi:hypothetical protein